MTRPASVFAVLVALLGPGAASGSPVCGELAGQAGARHGLPDGLLPAISLVETGRNGAAWPWTLNEGGKGMHFDTREEALAYLQDAVNRGVTNIDVGCMQLNYRWHASGFADLNEMIDPVRNTQYAALFMVELKKRLGSWEDATAHYHSADPDRGARYLSKVVQAAGAPLPDLPQEDQPGQMAGQDPGNGIVRGMLVAGAAPLVPLGASDAMSRSLERAAEEAARAEPRPMRARAELPPRLGRRWEAILAARAQLAARP